MSLFAAIAGSASGPMVLSEAAAQPLGCKPRAGANARVVFSLFLGVSEGSTVLFYVKDLCIHGCSSLVREVHTDMEQLFFLFFLILAKESGETRLLFAHE